MSMYIPPVDEMEDPATGELRSEGPTPDSICENCGIEWKYHRYCPDSLCSRRLFERLKRAEELLAKHGIPFPLDARFK